MSGTDPRILLSFIRGGLHQIVRFPLNKNIPAPLGRPMCDLDLDMFSDDHHFRCTVRVGRGKYFEYEWDVV